MVVSLNSRLESNKEEEDTCQRKSTMHQPSGEPYTTQQMLRHESTLSASGEDHQHAIVWFGTGVIIWGRECDDLMIWGRECEGLGQGV